MSAVRLFHNIEGSAQKNQELDASAASLLLHKLASSVASLLLREHTERAVLKQGAGYSRPPILAILVRSEQPAVILCTIVWQPTDAWPPSFQQCVGVAASAPQSVWRRGDCEHIWQISLQPAVV